MIVVILLVSSCRGPCCRSSAFDATHPNVVIDHVRTPGDALRLIPLAKPDLVVFGPDAQDGVEFRCGVARVAPKTLVGVLPCHATGLESEQCLAIRADFVAAVAPMLRARA